LNNNAGRIVVNAANLKLQSGALDNTDGLISHAGSGHGALQTSSLDNTRGQIVGNGTLSLASSGNVTNSDGLISSNGDLQLTSADLGNTRTGTSGNATGIQSQGGSLTVNAQAITNSSNLYAAKDLKTTATSLTTAQRCTQLVNRPWMWPVRSAIKAPLLRPKICRSLQTALLAVRPMFWQPAWPPMDS
jgi:filamentous hemagglutinin